MKETRLSVPSRALLADEHELFREGLSRLLDRYLRAGGGAPEGFEVVGKAAHGEEAVAVAREQGPDLVLTEVPEPLVVARRYLRRLLGACSPAPKIVVVTALEGSRLARALPEAGASACLHKSATARELLRAIRAPDAAPKAVESVPAEPPLSERELEVVLLAARGLTNRQIARTLHLSEATVKRHFATAYPKAGVRSRGEAAYKALAEGWISVEEITQGGRPADGVRGRAGGGESPLPGFRRRGNGQGSRP
ncbi:MAG: response regulator transcription factor [Actinomycetota bacterium]|nr:response regulator transcription factor [Actinomycetota bacterium]